MSSTRLEVVYEGPAVKAGTIDARLLGDSLIGYSEVFTRANAIVNGEASEAVVLVQSDFKHGSFTAGLDFVQTIINQAQNIITAHSFKDANELNAIIGFLLQNRQIVQDSVLGLFKWLRGKKPDKAIQVSGNNTEIVFGTSKKTVKNEIYHLYGDEAIRAALGRLTGPLRKAPIDRITVRHDGQDQAVIEKSEADYFETEPFELKESDAPMEGEREVVLIVSKLSFTEGSTWTFLEKGATVDAKIEDAKFWEDVHKGEIKFGEGDCLRVHLRWETVPKKRGGLRSKNTITKVQAVLPRHTQLRLGGRASE